MSITYNVIKELPNEQLVVAYKELKTGKLPPGNHSTVRQLQVDLYHENDRAVPLSSVQYRVAMEMLERFYQE